MRTGSVGNRSAEDMVRTLVEPKKSAISSLRNKLLAMGLSEDVEYDAINIEPVLIYSKSEERSVFLKHKWETIALIPIQTEKERSNFSKYGGAIKKFEFADEEGNLWLKFLLPMEEQNLIDLLEERT